MQVHLDGWETYAAYFIFFYGLVHLGILMCRLGRWLGHAVFRCIWGRGPVIRADLYAVGESGLAKWDGEKWIAITE